MGKFKSPLLLLLQTLLIASCTNTVQKQASTPEQKQQPKEEFNQQAIAGQINSTCPVLQSGKWYAWLDKEAQQEGQYRLNVNGEITLPNPGFDIQWSVGPTDRMHPPGLRLSLSPKPSNQMTIQVLTIVPVKYHLETPIAHFRHVSIYCAGKQLAQIPDVMLTD